MADMRRNIAARLAHLLGAHPACLIEGIRGMGKTSTATRLAAATFRLDDRIAAVPLGILV